MKKIIIMVVVALGLVLVPTLKATSYCEKFTVVEIDKSEQCLTMLQDKYVIVVENDEDFKFIRVPLSIENIEIGNNVNIYNDYIMIKDLKYSYHFESETITIDYLFNQDLKSISAQHKPLKSGINLKDQCLFFDDDDNLTKRKLNEVNRYYELYSCDLVYVEFDGSISKIASRRFLVNGVVDKIFITLFEKDGPYIDLYCLYSRNQNDKVGCLVDYYNIKGNCNVLAGEIIDNYNQNYECDFIYYNQVSHEQYVNLVDYQLNELENADLFDYYIFAFEDGYSIIFPSSFYNEVLNGNQTCIDILMTSSLYFDLYDFADYVDFYDYVYRSTELRFDYFIESNDFTFDWVDTTNKKHNVKINTYGFQIINNELLDLNNEKYYVYSALKETVPLMLSDDIFDYDYDKTYNKVIKIDKLNQLNDFNGKSGKCIISLFEINDRYCYQYDLFFKDDETHLKLLLTDFLDDYKIHDILFSAFTILNDELILEIVFRNERILYNISQNTTSKMSNITLSGGDIVVNHLNGIDEYYIYFNSGVSVDRFTSLKFDYSYHKEVNSLFGVTKYNYQNGIYNINTIGSVVTDVNNFDELLISKTFKNDQEIINNFEAGNFKVNNNNYAYKMRFLVTGTTFDKLASYLSVSVESLFLLGGIPSIINVIINSNNGYVIVDEFNAISGSFILNGVQYNNFYFVDKIVPVVPVDPVISDKNINSWNIKDFVEELYNQIKDNSLSWQIVKDYYGAVILCCLILFLAFYIIIGIIRLYRFRRYYKRF